MKVVEKRSSERTEVVDTLCDLCGVSVDDHRLWPRPNGENDEQEVEIRFRSVERDPWEVLDSKHTEVDCCPRCWADKVLPFLRSEGFKGS